jgi:archaellum component FlaC
MVSGFATLDNIDKQDDIVTTEASLQAFKNFRGNLREMHQPSAVGKIVSFKEDKYFDPNSKKFYSGVYVSAYVSKGAQDAWEKVLDGTYSGFSIGGNIKSWDDAYNADMDKAIRIIKDYDLYELSLVDSPANQFASIISVEKVNGHNVISGASVDAVIENVFYDSENGIVLVSDSETAESPVSGKNMENIGFVEKSDDEKANMIKFLVDSAKGISTIKITKEVNKMTEATEAVLDTVVENVEITPEAQPAEVETPAVVEAAATDTVVEKSDDGGAVPSAPVVEEESVAPAVEAELAVAKSDESVVDAIAEIKNSLTNAFGDLATTIKSLNEQVAALNKSIDDVSTEVTQVKGQFNEFGKRVDAVEQDTAFRKSGDLGEIVQFEPVKVQKSLWGGRFLKNSDLFN